MRTMTKTASAFLFAISVCVQLMAAAPCESLIALKLPNATITFAQIVSAGAFTPPSPFPSPGSRGGMTIVAAKDLPAFCRVAVVTRPSTDSEIKFEVWMPAFFGPPVKAQHQEPANKPEKSSEKPSPEAMKFRNFDNVEKTAVRKKSWKS